MRSKSTALLSAVIILALLMGAFIGFGIVQLSYIGPAEVERTEFSPVDYSDYVTILLTVVTILLTVLGIFIALIALYSFSFLKNVTVDEARKKSEKVLNEAMDEGGTIHKTIIEKLESDSSFRDSVIKAIESTYIIPLDEVDEDQEP